MLQEFSVIDIESRNWKNFVLGGWYDGKKYEEFKSMDYLMVFLFSSINPTSVVYAHFGGIFDYLFVFDWAFSRAPKAKITNIIMAGSKLLKFDITYKKKKISFIDSAGLFPFSLEKLTNSFDVKHKKKHINYNDIQDDKETSEYLMFDCKGLYECLEKFFSRPYIAEVMPQLTRSGISFNVFRNNFLVDPLPILKREVKDFARKSYFGGRTEIFKPLFKSKGENDKLYYQDINSLYPAVMQSNEYPSEFLCWTTNYFPERFGIYTVQVYAPHEIEHPVLGISHNGKYIFPTGFFQGTFTNLEINKALSLGYRFEKVIKGALFRNGGHIFKTFIDHFYNLRKNTSDPVDKIIYKDIMNHLYGRLGINELREQVSLEQKPGSKILATFKYTDYEIRLYSKEKKIFTYSNPVLSSFVTSYARLKLYEYFEKCNFDVYYCDTDSIFSRTLLETSNELGEMKLEDTLSEACFLLPKTYAYRNDIGEVVKKMKGFRADSISHVDIDDFIESISGDIRIKPTAQERGLARFKTAIKQNDFLTVLPKQNKQLKKKYDKRTIYFKDGEYNTRPLKMQLQGELI